MEGAGVLRDQPEVSPLGHPQTSAGRACQHPHLVRVAPGDLWYPAHLFFLEKLVSRDPGATSVLNVSTQTPASLLLPHEWAVRGCVCGSRPQVCAG